MLIFFGLSQTWPVTLRIFWPRYFLVALYHLVLRRRNLKVVTKWLFSGGFPEILGCDFLWQMSSQRGSQKLLQEPTCLTVYLSVFDIFLTHWIMAILSKRCKRENFESQNFLKLSFTNILGFRSNFGEWKSFFESNSPTFWLYARQTFMTQLILAISLW